MHINVRSYIRLREQHLVFLCAPLCTYWHGFMLGKIIYTSKNGRGIQFLNLL